MRKRNGSFQCCLMRPAMCRIAGCSPNCVINGSWFATVRRSRRRSSDSSRSARVAGAGSCRPYAREPLVWEKSVNGEGTHQPAVDPVHGVRALLEHACGGHELEEPGVSVSPQAITRRSQTQSRFSSAHAQLTFALHRALPLAGEGHGYELLHHARTRRGCPQWAHRQAATAATRGGGGVSGRSAGSRYPQSWWPLDPGSLHHLHMHPCTLLSTRTVPPSFPSMLSVSRSQPCCTPSPSTRTLVGTLAVGSG